MKKYLSKKIKTILTNEALERTKNIEMEQSRRALIKTVDYIELNMSGIRPVKTQFSVLDCALKNVTIPDGLYLEFGVYKGSSINYISKKIDSIVYGFDSFEGLPEFWRDGYDKGEFSIKKLPKVNHNVKLIKGWFDKTIPDFKKNVDLKPIAFLHVDCDLYSSTKTIFNNLKELIIEGTVIVFDEYFNYHGWEDGEFKAFRELISESGLKFDFITYNCNHEQVAVIIREKQ